MSTCTVKLPPVVVEIFSKMMEEFRGGIGTAGGPDGGDEDVDDDEEGVVEEEDAEDDDDDVEGVSGAEELVFELPHPRFKSPPRLGWSLGDDDDEEDEEDRSILNLFFCTSKLYTMGNDEGRRGSTRREK